jgi:monoamine oxidase
VKPSPASEINRRDFLALGASAAASALLPARGLAAPRQRRRARVVVIGAGLAGLVTARELLRGGVDSVLVIEARGRVGGRTVNLPIERGQVVEGGGEWVGPTHTQLVALARELGVDTFKSYYEGDTIFEFRGEVKRGRLPPLDLRSMIDVLWTGWKLERLASRIPLDRPWAAADAAALDEQTLASWLAENACTSTTGELFDLVSKATLTGRADRVSLLWFLFYVRSAGGLRPLIEMEGGAQDSRFLGGSQLVSIRLAEALGSRLVLESPVRRVVDDGADAVLVQSDRLEVEAERVVVAMMPADTSRIDFAAGLTEQRRELVRGWTLTPRLPALKIAVVYDSPFWRKDGLSGLLQAQSPPVQLTFDNSPPDGSLGVLGAFVSIAEAPDLADATMRRQIVIQTLRRRFGEKALEPIGYVEKDWALDPWSVGCVSPLPPGLISRFGPALREPIGRIHWAGTETAEIWNGYMEGAVRSGQRAAQEVLAALRISVSGGAPDEAAGQRKSAPAGAGVRVRS